MGLNNLSLPASPRASDPKASPTRAAGDSWGAPRAAAAGSVVASMSSGLDASNSATPSASPRMAFSSPGKDPEPAWLQEAEQILQQLAAEVQDYVDQSISSTINLPAWGSKLNNEDTVPEFAETLAKYAPRLRGFTCYPDGSRGGQPLTSVPYSEAVEKLGKESPA